MPLGCNSSANKMYTPNKKLAWLAEKTNHDWVDVYLLLKRNWWFSSDPHVRSTGTEDRLKTAHFGFHEKLGKFLSGEPSSNEQGKSTGPERLFRVYIGDDTTTTIYIGIRVKLKWQKIWFSAVYRRLPQATVAFQCNFEDWGGELKERTSARLQWR